MSKKRVDAEHETMLEKRKAAVDRLGSMQGQLKEAQESIGPKQQAMAQMESVLAALRSDSYLYSHNSFSIQSM